MKGKRKITIGAALIPVVFLVVALFFTLKHFGGDPHIPILASAAVATIVAITHGFTWGELENGVVETIKMSMSAILILMIIGMIIGTWILAGVVPSMIYYGLQILSPGIFLVATTLICAIVSLATGSSWTTAGTVGIALIGIGQGLGIPVEIVAGAIISGAYFGDKMSPLSDTTNLAPSMAGADLFDHIRHMIFTTGPSLIIALILYGIIGMKYAGNNMDMASINAILEGIQSQFSISPLLLIPPILVIAIVILKVPAIPGLIGGTLLGGLFAAMFQGAGMTEIIGAAHYGYESATGIEAIDSLLSRGGLDSMMWTVSLILCAMAFGGIMEKAGMLHAIAEYILKFANSTGSLVLSTILTAIAINLVAGDQYLSIVIPGRMYKEIYDEKGLHPKNLSRVLEDSGTLTSPLVPWNTCGSFMWKTLGVHPFAFLPYAFLNLLNPLVSIFYGYTGITMEKVKDIEPIEQDA
ncbi:Na+/H+ antiporter NhaC [Anaeromicrobium sediminis]|uniref:Na+/H+ antiporter NhaC n=1 Tax=Anaeromicrobium sediminis TaxID=1478221 RepID=A0A267MC29_9FIRM|nr:Na+/H+ antiporter NhaC [Anaeromicrobium sediminis]